MVGKQEEHKEVVRLINVTFSYDKIPVLDNINLSVSRGGFLAILGPNGSAKSTLLKIMLGILVPKSGEVKLFGQNVRHFRQWENVGYISQQASFINTSFPATVWEVVSSGLYKGFGRIFYTREDKLKISQALEAVGILQLANRLIGQLSGGQRQKVFLARALVKRPKALFLDEPTTGIDETSQQEFYRFISDFHKKGNTVIMVTHDIEAALKNATKIAYMTDKKLKLYQNSGNFSRFLSSKLTNRQGDFNVYPQL